MRPHLWRFALYLQNCTPDQPIDIGGMGVVPAALQIVAVPKTVWLQTGPHTVTNAYSANLKVLINATRVQKGQMYFTAKACVLIDRLLNRIFHQYLYIRIMDAVRLYNRDEQDTIRIVMEEIGITDDDFDYQTIKRKANLYRRRLGQQSVRSLKSDLYYAKKQKKNQ